MNHHALRLTPSNSPFHKNNTSPRSPTKLPRPDEPGLQLRHVIGTTTASSTAFDSLPSSRLFAHTAGACAVLAEVEATTEGLTARQRFYRARPTPTGTARDGGATPTLSEPRHRALGYVRESSVGGSPLASTGRDWSDSPSGRSTTAKDRVKAATSVALSRNGKWLALGETGYKPRIAIFCLADESSDSPVATISEHSFGVHALRFSPDSRYLASLGTVNDGFIYVWNIEAKTGAASLHASNKLTTLINVVAWVGDAVITAGLRSIKVWRPDDEANLDVRSPELASTSTFLAPKPTHMRSNDFGNSILSPRHKTLAGKNTLLGDLLECNFVAIVPLGDSEAIICAETGEICLFNDKEKAQSLTLVASSTFAISAARIDESGLLQVLGQEGCIKTLTPAEYSQPQRPPSRSRRPTAVPIRPPSSTSSSTIATAALGPIAVELDSERVLTLRNEEDQSCTQLAAHREAVQGVKVCSSEALPAARFLTFSANGLIQFWDADGVLDAFLNVPVPPAPSTSSTANELKSVSPFVGGSCIAAGDKFGVLSIADVNTKSLVTQVRAHSAEIMDLCAFQIEGVDLVATAGRDRMSQLFMWKAGQLSLLQTMDEHAGSVTGVLFQDDGRRLITHSTDRSVVVREAMFREEGNMESLAFVMLRAITVKTSPTSMCLAGDNELLIATVDRCIGRYRIKNGQCATSFKCSDADGGEAAVISKVLYASSLNGSPAIAGVASSDKSVRLYTEYGSLIARDWGHTEGITDVALIPADENCSTSRLVTVAADSTIFIWNTVLATPPQPEVNGLGVVLEATSSVNDVALVQPLRKIISHSDLSRHKRLKSAPESEPVSPTATLAPKSPQRLRKKPSRISTASTPRLEPAFLSVFPPDSPSRRDSHRNRSPSPPPPPPSSRSNPAESKSRTQTTRARRTSLATTLGRSNKSADNISKPTKSTTTSGSPTATVKTSSAASLVTSTESIGKTLRSYRKRLTAQHASNSNAVIPPAALRELEKELKLTLLALGARLEGNVVDEVALAKMLKEDECAGVVEKKVGKGSDGRNGSLDSVVENGVDRDDKGDDGCGSGGRREHRVDMDIDMDAVAGALGDVQLGGER